MILMIVGSNQLLSSLYATYHPGHVIGRDRFTPGCWQINEVRLSRGCECCHLHFGVCIVWEDKIPKCVGIIGLLG